jgi:hypothetical protein
MGSMMLFPEPTRLSIPVQNQPNVARPMPPLVIGFNHLPQKPQVGTIFYQVIFERHTQPFPVIPDTEPFIVDLDSTRTFADWHKTIHEMPWVKVGR